MKNKLHIFIIHIFLLLSAINSPLYANEANLEVVKGVITEVAKDSSYIVVNKQKIKTNKKFINDNYIQKGDKVAVVLEEGKPIGVTFLNDNDSK